MMAKVIRDDVMVVFGTRIEQKTFPKLFGLGQRNLERLKIVMLTVKELCGSKSWKEACDKIEHSKKIRLPGVGQVDILEYPAVYCWYEQRSEKFMAFFEESAKSMWGGDKLEAIKTIEGFFEKQLGKDL